MTETAGLNELLAPISEFVKTLDAADPAACEKALNDKFPPDSNAVQQIATAARAALVAGTLCSRGEPGMQFSRVIKPELDAAGCSVDAVLMEESAGPPHTHPNGEFCLCIHESGTPTFEDRGDTWIVMPKGSRHVPTVKDGRMLILYWLPDGAVTWG